MRIMGIPDAIVVIALNVMGGQAQMNAPDALATTKRKFRV
jgi:hypothetical protein